MDVWLCRRNGLGLAEIRPSKHHPVPGPQVRGAFLGR
jgi:hypothetical protein